jgi:predicted dehydrogenase
MKIALIGSRGHVMYVFAGLSRVPQAEIVAVSSGCEDSPEQLLAMCREHGLSPAVYDDWRQMISEVSQRKERAYAPSHKEDYNL